MLTTKGDVPEALDRAQVGFLTTVDGAGQPQTSTVWFLRQGDELLVYSRPGSPRMANLALNDRVAFNLRADPNGAGALTLEGRATLDTSLPPADMLPAYLEKYQTGIESLGYSASQFAGDYSSGIRIRVTKMRVFGIRHLQDS